VALPNNDVWHTDNMAAHRCRKNVGLNASI